MSYRIERNIFCKSVCAYARGINKMTSNPLVLRLCAWVVGRAVAQLGNTAFACLVQFWSVTAKLGRPPVLVSRPIPIFGNFVTGGEAFLLLGVDHPFQPSAPAPVQYP